VQLVQKYKTAGLMKLRRDLVDKIYKIHMAEIMGVFEILREAAKGLPCFDYVFLDTYMNA
jgi:hypothetical protein